VAAVGQEDVQLPDPPCGVEAAVFLRSEYSEYSDYSGFPTDTGDVSDTTRGAAGGV